MAVAHDIFAETNPAFCTCLLATFVQEYRAVVGASPDVLLCYVVLPLALSGDLTSTFEKTNRKTGLLEWLHRNPSIQIRLASRVNGSLDIVTEAIRYACFTNVLAMTVDGKLVPGPSPMPKHLLIQLSQDSQAMFKHIERLGCWVAMTGSTRTVLNMMGLEL